MKNLIDVLLEKTIIVSRAEGKRLIAQGRIEVNGDAVLPFEIEKMDVEAGDLIKVGNKPLITVE